MGPRAKPVGGKGKTRPSYARTKPRWRKRQAIGKKGKVVTCFAIKKTSSI